MFKLRPGLGTVCCGLEQAVTFTHCSVLVKPRKTWTDDSLSPRDLVSRPDNMDETVLSASYAKYQLNPPYDF